MKAVTTFFKQAFQELKRDVRGEVGVIRDGLPYITYNSDDYLVSFTIDTSGVNGRVFGYSLATSLTLNLFKSDDNFLAPNVGDTLRVKLGIKHSNGVEYIQYSDFIIDTIRMSNEKTYEIIAYDRMVELNNYAISEVDYSSATVVLDIFRKIAEKLNMEYFFPSTVLNNNSLYTIIDGKIVKTFNVSGGESLRDILNDICEVTGTIATIHNNKLTLSYLGTTSYEINKSNYFQESHTEAYTTLSGITSRNELGNCDSVGNDNKYVQLIDSNVFFTLNNSINVIRALNTILNNYDGIVIRPYDLEWRGNPTLDICDKVSINGLDTYYLSEHYVYNGGLKASSKWSGEATESAAKGVTSSISDNIRNTYAMVDKANKSVTLVADEVASIKVDTEGIHTSVIDLEDRVDSAESSIEQQAGQIELKVSSSDYNGDTIISKINLATDKVSIESKHIDLTGYVTFNDLTGNGSSTINGSNITTGTIDASKAKIINIDADNINAGSISADYISGGTLSGVEISADTGTIGSWYISAGIMHSTIGVYGTYSYTTTGTDLKYATGYMFTALVSTGIVYYIKQSNLWSSTTLVILQPQYAGWKKSSWSPSPDPQPT